MLGGQCKEPHVEYQQYVGIISLACHHNHGYHCHINIFQSLAVAL